MTTDDQHADDLERWVEWEPNHPYTVLNRSGIYRYRHHYRTPDGEARVVLFGGRAPAHPIDVQPLDATQVAESEMAMVRHAAQRGEVILDKKQSVTLLAWDVTRPKAKIVKASGAVLTVNKDRLEIPPPQGDQST